MLDNTHDKESGAATTTALTSRDGKQQPLNDEVNCNNHLSLNSFSYHDILWRLKSFLFPAILGFKFDLFLKYINIIVA